MPEIQAGVTLPPPPSASPSLQVEHDFATGATLEALRRLLLLVMLQDARILTSTVRPPMGPGPGGNTGGVPGMLLTMEELLTQGGPTAEQRLALGAVPNLIRMLNTGAAMLEGGCRGVGGWCGAVGTGPPDISTPGQPCSHDRTPGPCTTTSSNLQDGPVGAETSDSDCTHVGPNHPPPFPNT